MTSFPRQVEEFYRKRMEVEQGLRDNYARICRAKGFHEMARAYEAGKIVVGACYLPVHNIVAPIIEVESCIPRVPRR